MSSPGAHLALSIRGEVGNQLQGKPALDDSSESLRVSENGYLNALQFKPPRSYRQRVPFRPWGGVVTDDSVRLPYRQAEPSSSPHPSIATPNREAPWHRAVGAPWPMPCRRLRRRAIPGIDRARCWLPPSKEVAPPTECRREGGTEPLRSSDGRRREAGRRVDVKARVGGAGGSVPGARQSSGVLTIADHRGAAPRGRRSRVDSIRSDGFRIHCKWRDREVR